MWFKWLLIFILVLDLICHTMQIGVPFTRERWEVAWEVAITTALIAGITQYWGACN